MIRCILFDWGDTLMRELPEYSGPMADWPRVEALPGARQALAELSRDFILALASNARASDSQQIQAALDRVALGSYLARIYCYRDLGVRKPEKAFFQHILTDLQLQSAQVCMVGDSFEVDVMGAVRWGLKGVWLNEGGLIDRRGPGYRTIKRLTELAGLFKSNEFDGD